MMNHFSTRFVKLAFMLLVVVAIGAALRTDAVAQAIKAALVKNVDEPGRLPREITAVFTYDGCIQNCTGLTKLRSTENPDHTWTPEGISFDLPVVPGGKRWVIENISGTIPAMQDWNAVVLSMAGSSKWEYYGPFYPRYTRHTNIGTPQQSMGFSSRLFTTLDPGADMLVYGLGGACSTASGAEAENGLCAHLTYSITLSGYLIDATN